MPSSWHWSFGDGDTSLEQFPFHQYTTPGSHTVILTTLTAQGCGGSDTFTVIAPQSVGLQAVSTKDNSINVFPNPSFNIFLITCEGDMTHDVRLSLYNILGQSVSFSAITLSSEPSSRSIKLSVAESGAYILRIQVGSYSYYKKLLKQ